VSLVERNPSFADVTSTVIMERKSSYDNRCVRIASRGYIRVNLNLQVPHKRSRRNTFMRTSSHETAQGNLKLYRSFIFSLHSSESG